MWLLYNHAQTWKVRPSELVDLDDPYIAYCFDEAVAIFGNYVKNELDKVEGRNARDTATKKGAKLKTLLGQMEDQHGKAVDLGKTTAFKDPAELLAQKEFDQAEAERRTRNEEAVLKP